jgi:hypothetical protein
MGEPTPAEHAALVRSALQLDERVRGGNAGPLASLDALRALAKRATELEEEARKNFDWAKTERAGRKQERTRADKNAARVAELEAALERANINKSIERDRADLHEKRIEELEEQILRPAVEDYDRRRSHWWGRFLLWLLRQTT